MAEEASENRYVAAVLEAMSIIATTVVPIALVSTFTLAQAGVVPNPEAIWNKMWDIFAEGDIGYLILATAGTVIYLFFSTLRKQLGPILVIMGLVTVVLVIFSSMIIALPPSESPLKEQSPIADWAFWGYLASLIIFIYCRAAAGHSVGVNLHDVADSDVGKYLGPQ